MNILRKRATDQVMRPRLLAGRFQKTKKSDLIYLS
jgi:hypothetical protein